MPTHEAASLNNRAQEVAKMIQGLIKKIKRDLGDEDDSRRECASC